MSLQCLGAFLQASGNVVPSYYITTYSTTILLWSSSTSNLMLAINNGVNAISRILMGLFADTFGRQNTMVSSVRIQFFPIGKTMLPMSCRYYYPVCQFSRFGMMRVELALFPLSSSTGSTLAVTMLSSQPPSPKYMELKTTPK